MNKLHQRVELLSNVAIILGVILLGGVVVKRVSFVEAQFTLPTQTITEGTKLTVGDIDWSDSEKTLVMALSTTCHFCAESTPFYQQLAGRKEGRDDIRLVVVMPQPVDEARRYLDEHAISVDEVRQASLNSISVKGTPTLIVVDKTGVVVNSWVGKLPPNRETEVLDAVFH